MDNLYHGLLSDVTDHYENRSPIRNLRRHPLYDTFNKSVFLRSEGIVLFNADTLDCDETDSCNSENGNGEEININFVFPHFDIPQLKPKDLREHPIASLFLPPISAAGLDLVGETKDDVSPVKVKKKIVKPKKEQKRRKRRKRKPKKKAKKKVKKKIKAKPKKMEAVYDTSDTEEDSDEEDSDDQDSEDQYETRVKKTIKKRTIQTRSKTKIFRLPLKKGIEVGGAPLEIIFPGAKYKRKVQKNVEKGYLCRSKCNKWTEKEKRKLEKAVKKHKGKNWKAISNIVRTKTPNQCNQHWHRVLNPQISKQKWNVGEDNKLIKRVNALGVHSWKAVSKKIRGRTDIQCRHRYFSLMNQRKDNRCGKKRKRKKDESCEEDLEEINEHLPPKKRRLRSYEK